ncbi:hypothetical protein CCR75_002424 [Bremia lactucae]|uniref:RxLR effector protein n=1 Tax=Bremia lactucae TaxID=4779 RepID=A0A976IDE0_BRELC|nr:hypothetical protein CCR75_002424 [Bremia lactucae]
MSPKSMLHLLLRDFVSLLSILALLGCSETTAVVASAGANQANRGLRLPHIGNSAYTSADVEERTRPPPSLVNSLLTDAIHSSQHFIDPIINAVNRQKNEPSVKVQKAIAKHIETILTTDSGKEFVAKCKEISANANLAWPPTSAVSQTLDPFVTVAQLVSIVDERIPKLIKRFAAMDNNVERLAESAQMFIDELFDHDQVVNAAVMTDLETQRTGYWIFNVNSNAAESVAALPTVKKLQEMLHIEKVKAGVFELWLERLQIQMKQFHNVLDDGTLLLSPRDQLVNCHRWLAQQKAIIELDILRHVKAEFLNIPGQNDEGFVEVATHLVQNEIYRNTNRKKLVMPISKDKKLSMELRTLKEAKRLVDNLQFQLVGSNILSRFKVTITDLTKELEQAVHLQVAQNFNPFRASSGARIVKQLSSTSADVLMAEAELQISVSASKHKLQLERRRVIRNRVLSILEDSNNSGVLMKLKDRKTAKFSALRDEYSATLFDALGLSPTSPEGASEAKLWWACAEYDLREYGIDQYDEFLTNDFGNDEIKMARSILLANTYPQDVSLPARLLHTMLSNWGHNVKTLRWFEIRNVLKELVINAKHPPDSPAFAWYVRYQIDDWWDLLSLRTEQDHIISAVVKDIPLSERLSVEAAVRSYLDGGQFDDVVKALNFKHSTLQGFLKDKKLELLVRMLDWMKTVDISIVLKLMQLLNEDKFQLMLFDEALWLRCTHVHATRRKDLMVLYIDNWLVHSIKLRRDDTLKSEVGYNILYNYLVELVDATQHNYHALRSDTVLRALKERVQAQQQKFLSLPFQQIPRNEQFVAPSIRASKRHKVKGFTES